MKDTTTESNDDYTISSRSVTFRANGDRQSIVITAEKDNDVENEESFTLTLQDPENDGDVNLDDPHQLTVIIEDTNGKHKGSALCGFLAPNVQFCFVG